MEQSHQCQPTCWQHHMWQHVAQGMSRGELDVWAFSFPGHEEWLTEAWIANIASHISSVSEVSTEQLRDFRGFPLATFTAQGEISEAPPRVIGRAGRLIHAPDRVGACLLA